MPSASLPDPSASAGAEARGPEGHAAGPAPGRSARAGIGALVAVAGVAAVAVLAPNLLLGKVLALRDFLPYVWPARLALVDALRAGRLAEWNDFVGFGTPFAAMPTNGVLYPPQWIAALFPLPLGAHVVMALHLWAAGVGTGLLARRFGATTLGAVLAAGTLITSGYVASNLLNGTFLSIAWIPWVAWAADRLAASDAGREPASTRWHSLGGVALLAAMLAGQLLSGDPASAISAGLLALAVTLARAESRAGALARLAAAGALALPLAAVSVLPSLALLPVSSRSLGVIEVEWWLHPWRLVELVWPRLLGDPTDPTASLAKAIADTATAHFEPSWAFSVFVGGPVLALAVLGARAGRGLGGIGLASLVVLGLALGASSPLYAAYRAVFPLERMLQYPEKHLAGCVVLWCALAGAGLARLRADPGGRRVRFVLGASLPLGAALAAFVVLQPVLAPPLRAAAAAAPGPAIDVPRALGVLLASGAVALVVAALAAALLCGPRGWMPVAGATLLVAHGAWLARRVLPLVDAAVVGAAPALVTSLPPPLPGGARARVFRPPSAGAGTLRERSVPEVVAAWRHETLAGNVAARFGRSAFPGNEGFHSTEYDALWGAAAERKGLTAEAFASLYAIDYLALPAQAFGPSSVLVGASSVGWSVAAVLPRRPRAFVAQSWRWVPPGRLVAAALDSGRELGTVLLSDAAGREAAPPSAPPIPCGLRAHVPEEVELDCASPLGGYAVLADEHMPGWTATVDGVPAEIVRADVVLRAVRIGPGRHVVRFSYRTPLLRLGLAVSAASWLALLAAVAWARRRGRAERG